MAEVVPFPLIRRRAFIFKQAAHACEMNPDAGDNYIRHQIKIQGDSLRRKCIAEDVIERELKCLEVAIRCTMVSQQMQPGGAS
ncbi:DUF6074 family protein [Bradyrhizobium neotropicale]|uniref:DUF6074 family protein n=1 Tax=Bradyrhizobium neotropicale TaxID=1497615 RepID=UPI001AD6867D|nr:DUF6074 family protein [Bradyrhizobium neotropicale]MBO4227223.1 hypothetical protein [Bradyrhizobium neotropicale]